MQLQVIYRFTLVTISNVTFKKDKYVNDLALIVEICGQRVTANYKKNFEWSFPSTKI